MENWEGESIFRVDIAEFRRLERAIESTWVVECPLKISWPGFSFETRANACDGIGGKVKRCGLVGIRHSPFQDSRGCGRNENGRNCEYFPNGKLYRCETKPFFFFFLKKNFLVFNEGAPIFRWIFDYLCGIFLISFCQKQLQQLHRRSFIGRVK